MKLIIQCIPNHNTFPFFFAAMRFYIYQIKKSLGEIMLMHNSFFVFSLYRRHLWPSFIFWAQPCVLAWAPFTCGFRSAWTENESIRDPKNTKPKRSVLFSRTINVKIYCSRFFLVPLHFSYSPTYQRSASMTSNPPQLLIQNQVFLSWYLRPPSWPKLVPVIRSTTFQLISSIFSLASEHQLLALVKDNSHMMFPHQ